MSSKLESPLTAFIEAAKAQGASDEFLLKLLQTRGWPEEEIYDALNTVYEKQTGLPTPAPSRAARGESRDAFFLVLEQFAMAFWVGSLGAIIFMYIDQWFPQRLSPRNAIVWNNVAGYIASILVALPTQVIAAGIMARDFKRYPEKATSQLRKKVIYSTLFLVAGIAIVFLIVFLASLLRGRLTARFLMQFAMILVLIGGIFWYDISSLRRVRQRSPAHCKEMGAIMKRTNLIFRNFQYGQFD